MAYIFTDFKTAPAAVNFLLVTAITVATPTHVAGDLLRVYIAWASIGALAAINPPADWIQVAQNIDGGGSHALAVYERSTADHRADGTEAANYTWTFTGNTARPAHAVHVCYSNIGAKDGVDLTANSAVTPSRAGAVTDELHLCAWTSGDQSTVDAATTQRVNFGFIPGWLWIAVADELLTAANVPTRTATGGGATFLHADMAMFAVSAAVPGFGFGNEPFGP